MLQRLFVSLFRLIANTFFRNIELAGLENVPEKGPVINTRSFVATDEEIRRNYAS